MIKESAAASQKKKRKKITIVNGKANMIRYIILAKISYTINIILSPMFAAVGENLIMKSELLPFKFKLNNQNYVELSVSRKKN